MTFDLKKIKNQETTVRHPKSGQITPNVNLSLPISTKRGLLGGKRQGQVIYRMLCERSRYYYNESNKHSIGVEKCKFQKSSASV